MTDNSSVTQRPHTGILQRLNEIGLRLPSLPSPVASYVPAARTGNLIYTSGQLPLVSGTLAHQGKVGIDVSPEDAVDAARICTLNALAAISLLLAASSRIGELPRHRVNGGRRNGHYR
jgi:enamine deaminase RidA (YjgF/YER057c/UK114 family)